MNFQDYLKEEIKSAKPLMESVVQAGKTDTYKGDTYCGKHFHQYLLWDPKTGYGETGDALEVPVKGGAPVGGHVHMIVDGKVLEVAGHTHELLKPDATDLDTAITDIKLDNRKL